MSAGNIRLLTSHRPASILCAMDIDENLLYRQLGQRLKTARSQRELTQAQLADKSGVSRASIAVIELGKQSSPLHIVYRLCKALGLEVSDILPTNDEATTRTAPTGERPITDRFVQHSLRILEEGIPYDDKR